MTVGELVKHLKGLDQTLEVWASADDEGNSYTQISYEPTIFYLQSNGDVVDDQELDVDDDYETIVVL